MSVSRKVLVIAGVLVLVLGAAGVLLYPAWSAGRGEDVTWTRPHREDALLDFDAHRLLMVRDGALHVLDRATGEPRRNAGRVDADRRAALVPGGAVSSEDGRLRAVGDNEWHHGGDTKYLLEAVDVAAGLVVAGVIPPQGPQSLTAFALADGTPVWTVPDLTRAGPVVIGPAATRPPGWLREVRLVPVVPTGGYSALPETQPALWRMVDVTSGTVTGEYEQTDVTGPPVTIGGMTTAAWGQECADLTIAGGPVVTWPGEPLPGECFLVWAIDSDRLLFTAWEGGVDGDGSVIMVSVSLDSGAVTRLDWTGFYPDSDTQDLGNELTRAWGRHLVSRGVVYDTETGREKWRAAEVWASGDTAVTADPVTGPERLAAGASDEARWVRLTDTATGESTHREVITDHRVRAAYVLDHGDAVVLTTDEVFLLATG